MLLWLALGEIGAAGKCLSLASHTDLQLPRTFPEDALMHHSIADHTTVFFLMSRDPGVTNASSQLVEMISRNEAV